MSLVKQREQQRDVQDVNRCIIAMFNAKERPGNIIKKRVGRKGQRVIVSLSTFIQIALFVPKPSLGNCSTFDQIQIVL